MKLVHQFAENIVESANTSQVSAYITKLQKNSLLLCMTAGIESGWP